MQWCELLQKIHASYFRYPDKGLCDNNLCIENYRICWTSSSLSMELSLHIESSLYIESMGRPWAPYYWIVSDAQISIRCAVNTFITNWNYIQLSTNQQPPTIHTRSVITSYITANKDMLCHAFMVNVFGNNLQKQLPFMHLAKEVKDGDKIGELQIRYFIFCIRFF